jgi:hypothetical protein
MNRLPIITLTTDFGIEDSYVGTMKGVMLDIAPHARLVDITHQITPQDVRQTAYVLYAAYHFFPSQAYHLVVVDPGVGSARRAIAVQLSHGTFVGPDNGVFSYVMAQESIEAIVELANPCYRLPVVSETFHGRDVFAPGAAHLAAGVSLDQLGPAISDPVRLSLPRLDVAPGAIRGEVLHVDHFGNVTTSIGRLHWRGDKLSFVPAFRRQIAEQARFSAEDAVVVAGGRKMQGMRRTYAEVEPGHVLTLVGSQGHLEIAVREGSGAQRLGLHVGDPVELHW